MPLDQENIQKFLDLSEGDPPPVFVGREEVLDDILDTARRQAGRSKVTRIIQGAPGAGKTAILRELEQRCTGREGEGAPRILELSSTALMDDIPAVVHAVVSAGTLSEEGWKGVVRDRTGQTAGIGAFGFSYSRFKRPPPATLTAAAGERKGKPWLPVVVAVDEAQRLPGDETSPQATFLQSIHDGSTGLAMTLVLAGLSNTEDRASQMNLTRGATLHEIGCLLQNEAREFMEGLCGHFGFDVSRHLRQLHELTDLAEGWPRHLHFAAVALARAARAVVGDPDRFDWLKVGALAKASRLSHYQKQRSPEMRESDHLTARVMAGLRRGMGRGAMLELIQVSVGDNPRQQLPENLSRRGFLDHLVERGALYDGRDAGFHSPIPSFRDYLVEAGHGPNDPGEEPDEASKPSEYRPSGENAVIGA